jgi:ribose transport system permease protein
VLTKSLERYGLVVAWVVLIGIFSGLAPRTFPTALNFQTMFSTGSVLLLLCFALVPSLTAGEIDLSIAGIFGLAAVLVAYTNVDLHLAIGLSVAIAVVVGLLAGLLNAVLTLGLGIPSIIVTLGMGSLLAGIALGVTSLPISGVSNQLVSMATGMLGGLEYVFFFAVLATAVVWYAYRYTPLGKYLMFVGAGREVARLSGLSVRRLAGGSLVFGGIMAALAGVLLVGTQGSADPTAGPTYLLPVFAGAFLGSTAITPGRFNPIGTFVAVFFLQTGTQGLGILGLSGWVDQTFYGASLIAAVVISRIGRR